MEEEEHVSGVVGSEPVSFGPISKINGVVLPFQPLGFLLVDPGKISACARYSTTRMAYCSVVSLSACVSAVLSLVRSCRRNAYAISCRMVGAPRFPRNGDLKARMRVWRPGHVSERPLAISRGLTDAQEERNEFQNAHVFLPLVHLQHC
jgi:hypothetical protein